MSPHHKSHRGDYCNNDNGGVIKLVNTIIGGDPLLILEAKSSLLSAARTAGYNEHVSLSMDSENDWNTLIEIISNSSLFSDKLLIEIRLPTKNPGKLGKRVLTQLTCDTYFCSESNIVILVILPYLDKNTYTSQWAKALLKSSNVIRTQATIERTSFPAWIKDRLGKQNQKVSESALFWLAARLESNLLEAHQEIEKLSFLYPKGDIAFSDLECSLSGIAAHYKASDLRDAILEENPERAMRIIASLRTEEESLPLVLWILGEETYTLDYLSHAQVQGQDLQKLMSQLHIFGKRKQMIQKALSRVPSKTWREAISRMHKIDQLVKGVRTAEYLANPWDEIVFLVLYITSQ